MYFCNKIPNQTIYAFQNIDLVLLMYYSSIWSINCYLVFEKINVCVCLAGSDVQF